MRQTIGVVTAVFVAVALGGCRTSAQTGSLLGAGLGGAVGAVIGHNDNGHKGAGALIGTGVGALAGYAIGNELDKDKEQPGNRYRGDPRYEPGASEPGRGREPVPSYDDGSGRERVIYRETTVYETDRCSNCR
jgi:hypothetical protein